MRRGGAERSGWKEDVRYCSNGVLNTKLLVLILITTPCYGVWSRCWLGYDLYVYVPVIYSPW